MGRSVPEEKKKLAKHLIREGLTTRDIAQRVGIGTGTVTRMKTEMGFGSTDGRASPRKNLPKPEPVIDPEVPAIPYNPSAAALRLAQFDPVIARAIRNDPPPRVSPYPRRKESEE